MDLTKPLPCRWALTHAPQQLPDRLASMAPLASSISRNPIAQDISLLENRLGDARKRAHW